MDPYSQYQNQLEYYKYFEKQKENFVDLSQKLDNPNNSIRIFAEYLFAKSSKNLNENLAGMLVDDTMEIADIFCMLLELVLYGLNILSSGGYTIFDLDNPFNDIIYTIKSYLKSCGFDLDLKEVYFDENIELYRDQNNYYCEIVPKPPSYLCQNDWCVLNYRLINNATFKFASTTPLEKFSTFFISKQKKIFTINFKFAK